MLPRISASEGHSFSSIQPSSPRRTFDRCAGPFFSKADTICVTCAPAIVDFTTSSPVWTPPVTASEAFDERRDRRNPAQPQRQFRGRRQMERTRHLEFLHIDIRVIEAVEQHQPVGPFTIELEREVRERRKERRQLDRDGNPQMSA